MRPIASSQIPHEEKEVLTAMSDALLQISSADLGIDDKKQPVVLSCHILARSCSTVFGLPYADGLFRCGFQHSWLVTPAQHVIDVYPVGILTSNFSIEPIWVDKRIAYWAYEENKPGESSMSDDGKHIWGQDDFEQHCDMHTLWFRQAVEQMTRIIGALA